MIDNAPGLYADPRPGRRAVWRCRGCHARVRADTTGAPTGVRHMPDCRFRARLNPGIVEHMDDTERTMDPDTQRLFDAAGIVSTPETRQGARDKIAAAKARMDRPGAWDELRARHQAPRPA